MEGFPPEILMDSRVRGNDVRRYSFVIDTTGSPFMLSLETETGQVISEIWEADRHLDETFFEKMTALFRKAGSSFSSGTVILVNRGPGTYVGTRVCLSIVNSLALVTSSSLFGITGFDLMAQYSVSSSRLCCAINCVRHDVFYQCFKKENGKIQTIAPPKIASYTDFAEFARLFTQKESGHILFRKTPHPHTLPEEKIRALPCVTRLDPCTLLPVMHRLARIFAQETPEPVFTPVLPLYLNSSCAQSAVHAFMLTPDT